MRETGLGTDNAVIRCAPCLLVLSAVLAASSAEVAAALPVCPVSNGQVSSYDILRGAAVIGHQTIRYAVAGSDMSVTIEVSAALSALGVRVYRYEHHGEERWHDGQLVRLTTRTDDDGTPRQVDANRDATGQWHGTKGLPPTSGLLPSSLWNIQTVAQNRILDRETAEVLAIHAGAPQAQMLQLGTRQVSANKYDLEGLVKGSVWYDGSGCWVQALFHTRVDGSLIEIRAR